MEIHIEYDPFEDVVVTDDRGAVKGARVVVHKVSDVSGLVIPPEGDCPECWLPKVLIDARPLWIDERQWFEIMAECAEAGAIGKDGEMMLAEDD